MKREEITELMADFERTHPVEEWKVFDWHVWPLVRNRIAFSLYGKPSSSQHDSNNGDFYNLIKEVLRKSPGGRFLRDIASRVNLARKRLMARGLDSQLLPPAYPADVVTITPASRRVIVDGAYYDPYGDPIASLADELGLTALTWERGKPISRRAHPACSLTYFLRSTIPYHIPKVPDWFLTIQGHFKQNWDVDLFWRPTFRYLHSAQHLSRQFEHWLRRSGATILLLHCWYGPWINPAAILAANRANVTSVDLQHGLHDKSHFGYGKWIKVPEKGYELVPDVFWCWGRESAETTYRDNPCFQSQSQILVGGNLWLNKNLRSTQANIPDGFRALLDRAKRTVLVTLQHPGAFDEKLARSIRLQPEGWQWLIRSHPRYKLEDYDIVEQIVSTGNRWIDTTWANSLRLYELFPLVDLHVTGFSTCAQEALAFGIPSVLLHQSGREAYKGDVQKGVMLYLDRPEKTAHVFKKALDCSRPEIYAAAEKYFCPPDRSVENITRFFRANM